MIPALQTRRRELCRAVDMRARAGPCSVMMEPLGRVAFFYREGRKSGVLGIESLSTQKSQFRDDAEERGLNSPFAVCLSDVCISVNKRH